MDGMKQKRLFTQKSFIQRHRTGIDTLMINLHVAVHVSFSSLASSWCCSNVHEINYSLRSERVFNILLACYRWPNHEISQTGGGIRPTTSEAERSVGRSGDIRFLCVNSHPAGEQSRRLELAYF